MRRAAGVLLLAAATATACSGGTVHTSPTSLPPTTLTSTPISPPGVADTARQWVAALAAKQEGPAYAVMAPGSQAVVGGQSKFAAVASGLERQWGGWATNALAEFDAVPVTDGLAVVIMHAETKEHELIGAALPMRVVGGEWRPDPLETAGSFRFDPVDRSRLAPEAAIAVDVESGVRTDAFVDQRIAVAPPPKATSGTTQRVSFKPQRPFENGWHLVTLVLRKGDAVSAVTARYQVAPK